MLHLLLTSLLTALPAQARVSGRSFESRPLAREVVRLIENRALLVVEARPPMPAAIEKAINRWFEAAGTRFAHALTVLAQAARRTTRIG